jgi:hypothetical protein
MGKKGITPPDNYDFAGALAGLSQETIAGGGASIAKRNKTKHTKNEYTQERN